jgi:hypothetical protein
MSDRSIGIDALDAHSCESFHPSTCPPAWLSRRLKFWTRPFLTERLPSTEMGRQTQALARTGAPEV